MRRFRRHRRGVAEQVPPYALHRYVAEFEFRYNNRSANGIEDQERAQIALKGITGKRLTYRKGVDS